MSTDRVHPSAVGTNTKPNQTESGDYKDDPKPTTTATRGSSWSKPQVPNRPGGFENGLGHKLGGMAEEIKGKILREPEVIEHGHERRTGELMRKERERDNAADPFKASHAEGQ